MADRRATGTELAAMRLALGVLLRSAATTMYSGPLYLAPEAAQRERRRRHRHSVRLRSAVEEEQFLVRHHAGLPQTRHTRQMENEAAWSVGWHAGRLFALREAREAGVAADVRPNPERPIEVRS